MVIGDNDNTCTVRPALRVNSYIAIDRLMIELLDFNIPFLSFTNAGFKGYAKKKKKLNRTLEIDSPFQTLTVGLLVEFID